MYKARHGRHLIATALRALAFSSGAMALTTVMAMPAHAQSASAARSFDIDAQPLLAALQQFTEQSGIQVGYSTALGDGIQSSGVAGTFAPAEALSRLLTGTGLTYRFTASGTVTLERAPQASGATIQLGPVRVDGVSAAARSGYGPGETSAFSPVMGFVAKRSATGTKTDTPVIETPQSISIVTRDAMETRAVTSLRDALEYVPGVTARSYGEDDRYDWSTYRGFTIYNGGVYRDGLQDSGGQYAVPRTEIYGVERVEVLRGPASILYGNAAPGAIVNIVSKRPTAEARGEINVRAGNRNRLAIAGDVSGPIDESGKLLFRVVGLAERFDLLRPGVDKDTLFVQPSLTIQPGADTSLTVFAQYQREKVYGNAYPYLHEMIWPTKYRGASFWQENYDHQYRTQHAFWYTFDHRVSDAVTLRSVGRYSDVDIDYTVTDRGALNGSVLSRISTNYQDKMHAWAFDNHAQIDWGIGDAIGNVTLVGLDHYVKDTDLRYGGAATSSINLDNGQIAGTARFPTAAPELLAKYRQTGLYVQNQTRIADRVVITGGLRHDWYRSTERGPRASATPAAHDELTGRIGLVWLHPSGLAPYASYSTSFQPQSGVAFGGASFEPTTGRQYEIGLRYEPANANARLSMALFDLRRQNVLTPDPDHINFSIQTGEVGSRGFEAELNATLPIGLNVTGSYTYNAVTITKDTRPGRVGLNIPMVPRHKATLWADYSFTQGVIGGLNLGLGLRWNSKSWDTLNTLVTPASPVLIDARLGYNIGRWGLALNAQNILDKTYFVTCAFNNCHFANPATVTANLTYRW